VNDFGADFDEEGQPLDAAGPAPEVSKARDGLESAVDEAQQAVTEADREAEKVEA
jgi:hypothetical protein